MRAWRTSLAALGFGLALLILLFALRQLAAAITATHLLHQSGRLLATLQSGEPPWHWEPREPEDLIAGRAFGAANLAAGRDGVRMTSRDGSPFQIGLRLAQPIDLANWPRLVIQGHASAAGTLGLVQQTAGQPACLAPHAARLPAGYFNLALDLRTLGWQAPCTTPGVTDLLRLQPRMPAGASLQLLRVALRSPAASFQSPSTPVAAPSRPGHIDRWAAAHRDLPAAPVLRLPAPASTETLLALRDQLRRFRPAALFVVGEQRLEPASGGAATPGAFAWAASALYLAGLLWLGLRPRQGRAAGWLEVAAIVLGPLWLIAGLQWGSAHPQPAVLAFAAALLYAARAEWPVRPRGWRWLGSWRGIWLALLPLPIGLALVALLGHGWHPPRPGGAAIYLLWAALQQWLMLAVVMRRVERLVPVASVAILLTATAFALMHTPNGVLMQLCLLAECWWAWCFLRSRALLPITVAHAACALLVQAGLVGTALRSMEVSARFFL